MKPWGITRGSLAAEPGLSEVAVRPGGSLDGRFLWLRCVATRVLMGTGQADLWLLFCRRRMI